MWVNHVHGMIWAFLVVDGMGGCLWAGYIHFLFFIFLSRAGGGWVHLFRGGWLWWQHHMRFLLGSSGLTPCITSILGRVLRSSTLDLGVALGLGPGCLRCGGLLKWVLLVDAGRYLVILAGMGWLCVHAVWTVLTTG